MSSNIPPFRIQIGGGAAIGPAQAQSPRPSKTMTPPWIPTPASADTVAGAAPAIDVPNLEKVGTRFLTLPTSYQAPAVAFTWSFMTFPQVTPGRFWEVMRVSIVANDPSSVLAGVVAIGFVSQQIPQDGANPPVLVDPVALGGQIPNTYYPARLGLVIREQERFCIAIKGLANAQAVLGSIFVIDRDKATFMRMLQS